MQKCWIKPSLIVIVRDNPGEFILWWCKTASGHGAKDEWAHCSTWGHTHWVNKTSIYNASCYSPDMCSRWCKDEGVS